MLKAQTHSIASISEIEKKELYQLFSRYYEASDFEKFIKDFDSKDDVILLRCKEEGIIRGFSTLKKLQFTHNGKVRVGIFSGDTIIDENFWGATALTFEFFKYVLGVKRKHLFQDVYWLLISKGFKTYLLLANNFQTYYPRFDRETPNEVQSFMDSSWLELYPKDYCLDNKILLTANKYDRLKEHVAKIGEKELSNPKIAFFQDKNPRWAQGDELCCVGRVDLGLCIRYSSRTLYKLIKCQLNRLKGIIMPIRSKN